MSWNGRIKLELLITVFLGRLPPLGPTGVAALLLATGGGRCPTGVAALLFATGGGRRPTGVAALLFATGSGRWSSLAQPCCLLAGGGSSGGEAGFIPAGTYGPDDDEDDGFVG